MGTFGITARFPLGVYVGHRADGRPDEGPDPARLHSALVYAAYTGSTAVVSDGRHDASPEARKALEWMELHPPAGIEIPRAVRQSRADRIAYRKEGVLRTEGRAWKDKTTGRAVSDGWAVSGHWGWSWNGDVPESVQQALRDLCADVSCLGEGHSPVILECGNVKPTHVRSDVTSRFDPGGRRVRVPAEGRMAALDAAHYETTPARRPSIAADRHKSSELPNPSVPAKVGVAELRYRAPRRPSPTTPWTHAVVIFIDSVTPHADIDPLQVTIDGTAFSIPGDDRVTWAVALHRAIVKRIGVTAPALITGRYPDGAPIPSNRAAIQVLDPTVLAWSSLAGVAVGRTALAILVPGDAANDDILVLRDALQGLRSLWTRFGVAEVSIHPETVLCPTFWREPAAETTRLWAPSPAVVPDGAGGKARMGISDAILLSLAYVLRDQPIMDGLTGSGRQDRVAHLKDRGLSVHRAHRLAVDAARFVHKIPRGMVAEPCSAFIDLRGADHETSGEEQHMPWSQPTTTLLAIGQSRHLGGGLLVPVDMPADLAATILEE